MLQPASTFWDLFLGCCSVQLILGTGETCRMQLPGQGRDSKSTLFRPRVLDRPISISLAFCCSNIPRRRKYAAQSRGCRMQCRRPAGRQANMYEATRPLFPRSHNVAPFLPPAARPFTRSRLEVEAQPSNAMGIYAPSPRTLPIPRDPTHSALHPSIRPFPFDSPFQTGSPSPPRRPSSRWSRRGRAPPCCLR